MLFVCKYVTDGDSRVHSFPRRVQSQRVSAGLTLPGDRDHIVLHTILCPVPSICAEVVGFNDQFLKLVIERRLPHSTGEKAWS